MKNVSTPFFAAILLIACQRIDVPDSSKNVDIPDSGIDRAALESYVKLQGIPDPSSSRAERAMRVFIERNAMADEIAKLNQGDAAWFAEVNADIRHQHNEILINHYIEQQVARATSQQKIEEYYKNHIGDYTTGKALVSLVLVVLSDNADLQEREQKRELAKTIADNIRNGRDAKAGIEGSVEIIFVNEPDKPIWIQNDNIDKKVIAAAMGMTAGSVSDPIETAQGYYVAKLLEEPVKEVTSLKAVEDKIAYKFKYDVKLAVLDRLKQSTADRVSQDIDRLGLNSPR